MTRVAAADDTNDEPGFALDSLDGVPVWAAFAGQHAPDAMVVADSDGQIVWASPSTERVLGHRPADVVGQQVEMLVPPDQRHRHIDLRTRQSAAAMGRPLGLGLNLTAQHKDGHQIPVEISLTHLVASGRPVVLAVLRDRSAEAATEAALRKAEIRAQQALERARIARDLHDTVSQDLFAVQLTLKRLEHAGGARPADLDHLTGQIDASIRQLANVIFELRSDHGAGLPEDQIHTVAAQAARVLGFVPTVRIVGSLVGLDPDVMQDLIRVLREMLSNVSRHAHATHVGVDVTVGDVVMVTVVDDGVGWGDAPTVGAGISNMVDRARRHGGWMERTSGVGDAGARVRWAVPFTPASDVRGRGGSGE